ncbi:MAG: DUF2085 domain-containing protein [Leptolyngbyaceae cyanobacterium bins.302]|nr:DUF2085 domain-containing protein [Leptolyngbyaceae cyanobacterium bins.302]
MTKSVLQFPSKSRQPLQWRNTIADILLIGLVSGPVAAPFLAGWNIFPLPLIASIIYFMGSHVCPQPEMGLMLNSPHLMSVCMRCYGVLLALVTTRLLFSRDRGTGFYWLKQYRFQGATIATILTAAYLFEMLAELWGWWSYNNFTVTLFGFLTGLGIGLFLTPVVYVRRYP